jgi:hypothetical protein
MKKGKVIYNKNIFLENLKITETGKERRVGFLKTKGISKQDGMLITKCKGIHTFFMKFPISVIFLDKKEKIVRIDKVIPPFKIIPLVSKASKVLEFSVRKDISHLKVGDYLKIEEGENS